jgi:ribosomal protein S18 acetylase RimI-like enzyme
MDLLAAYFRDREGFESIITSKGFASYKIIDYGCYIRDIWVARDFRNQGVASELADQIAAIAKDKGCTHLIGSVSIETKNATDSTKVLLAYGFEIANLVPSGIIFRKDI